MEEEDYWTKSDVKKFSFDDDDNRVCVALRLKKKTLMSLNNTFCPFQDFTLFARGDNKLFIDDSISEISYDLQPSTDIPMHLIISDQDLHTSI